MSLAPPPEIDFRARLRARFFPKPSPYVHDAARWVEEELGEELWSAQTEICEAVEKYKRVAIRACHGPGKTRIVSRLGLHWIDVHPPGTAKVITTAPSFWQVRGLVWSEMLRGHKKGKVPDPEDPERKRRPLPGRISIAQVCEWMLDGDWVAQGRKPPDPAAGAEDETIQTMQGIHADNLLIIVDEACGVKRQMWMAITSLMTTGNCHVVAIGNPDDPDSYFAELFKPESIWHQLHIPLARLPAFQGGKLEVPLPQSDVTPDGPTVDAHWPEVDTDISDELLGRLPGGEYLTDFIDEWGMDGNAYQAKVLANFPQSSKDGVIPFAFFNRCSQVSYEVNSEYVVKFGWDVAEDGGDQNVLTEMRGPVFIKQTEWRSEDPMQGVGKVIAAIREARETIPFPDEHGIKVRCNIDAIGSGWGCWGAVVEKCRENGWEDVEVNAIKVSEASREPEKYLNLRAEMYWMARDVMRDAGWDVKALHKFCKGDWLAPKWKETSNGLIQIEEKKEIKKRLKRSPDYGESALLAAYIPERQRVSSGPYKRTARPGRR